VSGANGKSGVSALARLAILCGAGAFPLEVAGEARRVGRDPFLIGVVGVTDTEIEAYPHVWVRLGEVGKLFAALKGRAIAEMVIIGAMTRPEFADLRLDWGAVKRAAGIAQLFRRGDNGLLAGIAAIIEREGVRVVGAHEVAPRLLAPVGRIGSRAASTEDETDIAFGGRLLRAVSTFDAGQGVIVASGRVLAIEAAEGTDGMIARVADMRASGRLSFAGSAGVLVKAPKQGQDLRLDMPAIGPKTIEGAIDAQLRGVAIASGQVLLLEREVCAREADAEGLFVAGFAYPGLPG
jgi:DUF1009 family protein